MKRAVRIFNRIVEFGGAIPALIVVIGLFTVAFLANESPPSPAPIGKITWSAAVTGFVSAVAIVIWFVSRMVSIKLSRLVFPLYVTFVFYGHIQGLADDLITFEFVRDRLLYSDRLFAPVSIIVTLGVYFGLTRIISFNSTVTKYTAGLLVLLTIRPSTETPIKRLSSTSTSVLDCSMRTAYFYSNRMHLRSRVINLKASFN